jgi:hypothetical protein
MVNSTLIGTVVGAVAGYHGRAIDAALMSFVNAMLCFPSIFLLLTLAACMRPNIVTITIIIAATSWMEVARIVEGQIRSLRERDFAIAAEMLGASDSYIIFRELLPNAIAPIVVAATLTVARAILMESYSSFLGYGVQPPVASWSAVSASSSAATYRAQSRRLRAASSAPGAAMRCPPAPRRCRPFRRWGRAFQGLHPRRSRPRPVGWRSRKRLRFSVVPRCPVGGRAQRLPRHPIYIV